jgi:hypothetical protein
VSLYLALAGQRSCGCFGRVTASPWLTFAIDSAALVALVIWRPGRAADVHPAAWLQGLLKTVAGAAVLLTLIGGAFLMAFDYPAEALARLRGESITVEPNVSHIGDGVAGEQRAFNLQLKNNTARPIRVVGGTTSCSCMATSDLPITVPPGEARPIEVRMTFGGGTGRFQHRFILYTDDEKQWVVVARFTGRVVEPP